VPNSSQQLHHCFLSSDANGSFFAIDYATPTKVWHIRHSFFEGVVLYTSIDSADLFPILLDIQSTNQDLFSFSNWGLAIQVQNNVLLKPYL